MWEVHRVKGEMIPRQPLRGFPALCGDGRRFIGFRFGKAHPG
jgi:hypothetical protein